ncbi:phosphoglucomutase [Coniophora puteana RWD-64-598 SS2]|uniref:phosphoglucomutase (alpha-D-glucose-1,6-bisphosphate-dependent) n=1 Tax=Coniophora puteana (strain RWD-64-598) TaxID=741705 RepID=A0A5M3MJN9_CONPW|nr:phosphoglucomutase [Coniophora puteana RWD-64-598 SS2]EIW79432.1 phosphoglucomutase [Coniophora puteana RWD-64-598 SS2]
MSHPVNVVATKPFDGQKPGTSGLRKRVKVFQQEHYTENFVQAIFDSIKPDGMTLVVGGDGRFFSPEAVQIILKIGSANGVKKFILGKDGILSTPAASNVIRKYKADGGILLTASHNPGGPNNDFGLKYNVSNGGPAPESVTDKIYEITKTISQYKVIEAPPVDLSKIGETTFGPSQVQIIDSVTDYVTLLQDIFDFPLIKSFLLDNASSFRVLFDGLHGVTGPYAHAILVETLGLPPSAVQNCVPSPDFGGGHPDPNLTYARSLVDVVEANNIQFGAASDGDGDRNMIYGKGAFVTPSDSVAIIADWAHVIPYFKKGGVKGLARSMPTSKAIDLVAQKKGLEYFEVPTGWKFFGNLMDAGRLSICGEESFGTGSDHIREKDGIWAIIAWLNILAAANKESPNELIGINELLQKHYAKYGRSFFSRYDYEEVPSDGANKIVALLDEAIKTSSLNGTAHVAKTAAGQEFTIASVESFSYTDPIDGSVSTNQGQVLNFADGSRVVFRLSGTGSAGATVRMYVERYVAPEAGAAELGRDTAEGLKGLIEVALGITKLKESLGREEPTVITVRLCRVFLVQRLSLFDDDPD